METPVRCCAKCLSKPPQNAPLQVCGKCKCSYYCSKKCQRDDWLLHRVQCKQIENIPKYAKMMKSALKTISNNRSLLDTISFIALHNVLKNSANQDDLTDAFYGLHPYVILCSITQFTDVNEPIAMRIVTEEVDPLIADRYRSDSINIAIDCKFNNSIEGGTAIVYIPVERHLDVYQQVLKTTDLSKYSWPAKIVLNQGHVFMVTDI